MAPIGNIKAFIVPQSMGKADLFPAIKSLRNSLAKARQKRGEAVNDEDLFMETTPVEKSEEVKAAKLKIPEKVNSLLRKPIAKRPIVVLPRKPLSATLVMPKKPLIKKKVAKSDEKEEEDKNDNSPAAESKPTLKMGVSDPSKKKLFEMKTKVAPVALPAKPVAVAKKAKPTVVGKSKAKSKEKDTK